LKRLAIVLIVVAVAAVTYRSFGSAETGTGSLTLPQPAPAVGDTASGFTAKTVEGDTFELSDKGLYVLTFWSTLNEGSNRARPDFARVAQEYADDGKNGIHFAAVFVDSRAPSNGDAPYTMIEDRSGKLTSLYNVKRVPRTFLIHDGDVVLVQNGYYEENKKNLKAALDAALKQS
jgi:thiol-disulfide isomerase/thioredoxin